MIYITKLAVLPLKKSWAIPSLGLQDMPPIYRLTLPIRSVSRQLIAQAVAIIHQRFRQQHFLQVAAGTPAAAEVDKQSVRGVTEQENVMIANSPDMTTATVITDTFQVNYVMFVMEHTKGHALYVQVLTNVQFVMERGINDGTVSVAADTAYINQRSIV